MHNVGSPKILRNMRYIHYDECHILWHRDWLDMRRSFLPQSVQSSNVTCLVFAITHPHQLSSKMMQVLWQLQSISDPCSKTNTSGKCRPSLLGSLLFLESWAILCPVTPVLGLVIVIAAIVLSNTFRGHLRPVQVKSESRCGIFNWKDGIRLARDPTWHL